MNSPESPRIALLGLGIMGEAIGERLLDRGFPLSVWNRTAEKGRALLAGGARTAPTPAEAVADAPIVALCLRDSTAVEDVLFGRRGVAESLAAGAVVVDFSTIGISPARRFAERLAKTTSSAYLDAPVSGGPSAARAGMLAVFCGGTDEAVASATSLLTAVSRQYTHMGPVGSGQATKLCNQLIVSTTIVAIAEAIGAAEAFGIDARALPAALAGGYADSTPLRIFGPRMASRELEPKISEVETMRKDVKALLEAAADAPIRLRIAHAAASVYDLAVERGLGQNDLAALATLVHESEPAK